MAKKPSSSGKTRKPEPKKARRRPAIDYEKSPWFTPISFAIIFLALLVLFGSFIFSDKMLSGSDTIIAGVFFRAFLVDSVHESGSVPQWNPYIFGGMPYVEAFHGDIFYPLSFLKYFGSLFRMLGLILFFHIFLAGIFAYLAARQFRLSKIAALMSGVSYMFAAYLISLVAPGHDGKIFVTTLFPLVILFLEGGFSSQGFRSFFKFSMLGLVLGVIILSPHPQMSYYTLWATAFYAVFKMIVLWRERNSVAAVIRPAVLTAYAVVIGLLISAIQFYPGYLYTTEYSPRADSKSGWDWATSWSLHEEETFSMLIPEFAGVNNRKAGTYYWGKNYFKDNSESVGVVALFVAAIGFFFYRRKESYFFGGLALFALIYALGATTPIFKLFFLMVPKVKSLRAPSMIMFMFSFSVAMLAGMGVQYMRDRVAAGASKVSKNFDYLVLGVPALMLLIAFLFSANGKGMLSLWSSLFYSSAATEFVQQGVTKLDLANLNLPHIQSGAWFAFLFTALASLLIWLYRSGKAGTTILLGLVLIPVINGVRFNDRFVETVDPDRYWSSNPVAEFLQEQPGEFRVWNVRVLPEDLLPYFGVEVVTGYHGNQLRWYDELLGGPGAKNSSNPHFLNLVGARYVLVSSQQNLPPDYFGEKPLAVAANFGSARIMRNDNALPRAFLPENYAVIEDPSAIYEKILTGADDPRQTVYLEQEPPITVGAIDSLNADSAWVVDHAIDSVVVDVDCSVARLLVLTDNYYDAWQVSIDGDPAELMRAYGTFRAVTVPPGKHRVLFKYESSKYATGKLATLLTSLYLLAVVGVFIARRKFGKKDKKETAS